MPPCGSPPTGIHPAKCSHSRLCRRHEKPCLDVTPGGAITPGDVAEWIGRIRVRVLNVAGNSERTSPGMEEYVAAFLGEVFRLLVRQFVGARTASEGSSTSTPRWRRAPTTGLTGGRCRAGAAGCARRGGACSRACLPDLVAGGDVPVAPLAESLHLGLAGRRQVGVRLRLGVDAGMRPGSGAGGRIAAQRVPKRLQFEVAVAKEVRNAFHVR